ncbi:nitric oxide reductase F protein [Profundibacter sp.]|uniref:nitric oxide reductase F protein n=1 Tax=Profundibacter sp. TaxID=3101071 RepID=UPI003D0E4E94
MLKDKLFRAWIALLVLSATSTAVAIFIDRGKTATGAGWVPAVAGAVILLLALIKGRIILSRYLGLETTRFWRRGFNTALTLYALVLLGLYLAPML